MSSAPVPNANGNLFELKTTQGSIFRNLVEALKEILMEANLEFDPLGVRVLDMDKTHTVMVFMRLHADKFTEFYCPSKFVVGVNMIYLYKLIKSMGNNDILTLYLPASNPNKLGIRLENAEKSTSTNFFLKLFDTNLEEFDPPNLSFTSTIHMSSAEFQKVCRDMNARDDGDEVEITSVGSDLIFRNVGDYSEQETILTESASMKIQRVGKNEIVQGVFQLKHLVLFTKCTNLCQAIEMYMKNDYPLIIRYNFPSLGEVKLVLAGIPKKSS